MLKVPNTSVVLTGIYMVNGIAIKVSDDRVVDPSGIGILKSDGTLAEPSTAGLITHKPHVMIVETLTMPTGQTHIDGSIIPVNSTVNVSNVVEYSDTMFDELTNNLIMRIKSDSEGSFSMDLVNSQEPKQIMVWSELAFNISMSSSASMDLITAYSDNTEPLLVKTTFSFGSITNTSGATPVYTLSGTCPLDVSQVFISLPISVPADNDELYVELQNTLVGSAIASNGNYSVQYSQPFETSKTYYVWCLSATSANITASYTCSTGTVQAVCLSGDTPILLYDGSQKLLKHLTMDDILMSGDSTPTRITQIKRGGLSDFHTLYYFDYGIVIDEAHRHRFYNVDAGFWQYLDEWKIGDRAKHYNGIEPKLIGIERVDEPCMRYGLWTESHDYFANGLLSGETAANQSVLSGATLDQAIEMLASLDASRIEKLYEGELG